jgi:regulator of sirC expression with transglutaminase-like and TPR domain
MEADEEPALEVKDLKKQLAIIAIGTYSRMINADPSNALAYRERGKWYHELDRAEVGAKDLEEAKRLSPE